MPRLTRTLSAATADAEGVWLPRTDVVLEEAVGPGRFHATVGPFAGYERMLTTEGDVVTEVTRYKIISGFGAFPFTLFYRSALRRSGRPSSPWWAPSEPMDGRAAATLGSLCVVAAVAGYLGMLLTQTMTFAADDFDASKTAQSTTLAIVRTGVLATVVITALADRRGRRRLLLLAVSFGCVACAIGAVAPNLATLGASQVAVRAVASACTVLLTVIVAEEMPAGARAYGITVLGLAGAIGVGACLFVLPIADVDVAAWRVLYALPLLWLLLLRRAGRHLPESRRFEVQHQDVPIRGHGWRLALLAASALLLNVFKEPASQLLNEFLRDERGFSAARVSLFNVVTNVPGLIGVLVGGRLADTRGRRQVGAIAVLGGCGFTVLQMLSDGPNMWTFAIVSSIIGGAALPALGVYGPELFPTSLRGRANGVILVVGTLGTVSGVLAVGTLSDRWDGLGRPLALLSIAPLILAVLIAVAYPETAHRELEQLNPEDPALAPQPAPRSASSATD